MVMGQKPTVPGWSPNKIAGFRWMWITPIPSWRKLVEQRLRVRAEGTEGLRLILGHSATILISTLWQFNIAIFHMADL